METGFLPISVEQGLLFYIPTLHVYLGLHQTVLAALERRDPNSIREFANVRFNSDIEEIENSVISVYADGVMIALLQDLEFEKIHPLKKLLHTRKPVTKS